MPPVPDSEFVFDAQAWSMASRVTSLSFMATKGEEAAMAHPVLPDPAVVGKENDKPMERRKSAPSLASLLRGSPLRKSLPRKLSNRDSDDGGASPRVTVTRSKSFVAPKTKKKDGDRSRSVGRNRSRETVGASSSCSVSDSTTSDPDVTCDIHPQVRMRRNRCPRCAAGELKKMRSMKNLRKGAPATDSAEITPENYDQLGEEQESSSCRNAEENNSTDALNEIMKNILTNRSPELLDDAEEDASVEEVSLDPKWAEALRGISMRLANERAQEREDATTEGDSFPEGNDAPIETEQGESSDLVPPPQRTSLSALAELQDAILQASESTGRYPGGVEDEGDDRSVSESSFARDTPVTSFAESKKRHERREDPLSFGLEFFDRETAIPRGIHQADASAGSSSGSDASSASSVTMSIASGYTLESYNSLLAPPPPPPQDPLRLKKKVDISPTSVLRARDLYRNRSDEDESSQEEEEEDHQRQDFDSSFYNIARPKDYSERKAPWTQDSDDATYHRSLSPETSPALDAPAHTERDQQSIAGEGTSDMSKPAGQVHSNPQNHRKNEEVLVEDVLDDSDDEGTPIAISSTSNNLTVKAQGYDEATSQGSSSNEAPDTKRRERSSKPPKSTRRKSACKEQPSFFSALVHNSRARSRSRARRASSRSKSRPRNDARSKSRPRNDVRSKSRPRNDGKSKSHPCNDAGAAEGTGHRDAGFMVDQADEHDDLNIQEPATASLHVHSPQQSETESQAEANIALEESRQSTSPPVAETEQQRESLSFPSGVRGPITHPHYKLGDAARDEDMIVFKAKSVRGRRGRRKKKIRGYGTDDSSSDSDSEDEGQRSKAHILLAVAELGHLDAAFVRRSDGEWTYALVADGDDNQIRFVVNERGSTKSFPKSLWKSSVRRIRVLTQREGDRMAINTKQSRRKRTIGKSRSFRGRGKGRLVSPSPTRRNTNVLNLPPTIMENRAY